MKNLILYLFSFLCISNFVAQNSVSGTVKDEFGFKLKNVSISDNSNTINLKTDKNGNFTLELNQDSLLLNFYLENYIKQSILVNTNTINPLEIILYKEAKEIDSVMVIYKTDKDKGKEIMKKVIDKRPYYQSFLNEYQCKIYSITTLTTNIYDTIKKDSIIGNKSLGINEWESNSYHKNNLFKDEYTAVNEHLYNEELNQYNGNNFSINVGADFGDSKTSIITQYEENSNPYLFVKGIKQVHFSIYDNLIESKKISDNPIISPLAYNAFIYYNFYYDHNFLDSNNQLIHKVRVEPKLKYEAVLLGDLFIVDGEWYVKSFNLEMNSNVTNFFETIEISSIYTKKDSCLVPTYKEYNYLIKDGKDTIIGTSRINLSNYQFKVDDKQKKFWLEVAKYKDDAYSKDSTYWEETRGFPLKSFELDYIHKQDSALNYHESEAYLKRIDSIRNEFNWKNLVFGGWGHVNSFKKYELQIRPLIATFQPFGVGGIRSLFDISYQKEFENGKIIYVKPFINYGYYNKDLMGSFDGSIMYNRLNFSKIGFKIGKNYDRIANTQNVVSSIFPTNLVKNERFEFEYSREIKNGVYMNTSILYSDRSSIKDIQYPHYYDSLAAYVFQKPMDFNRYKILLFTSEFQFVFRQQYKIKNGKKIVYGSPWPSLFVTYKKAIPTLFQAEANFDYLEVQLTDEIHLNSIGVTNLKFIAGQFLQKQNLRLIEYKYFRPSDMFFFSNPINTMQLLNQSLNTSQSYLQFNYIHHFNGFFTNKIWGINRLKLEETFGGGVISIPEANFIQNEFYIGLERKFRVRKSIFKLGIYAVTNQNNFDGSHLNFKIGINSYNNFTDSWDY